MLASDFYVVTTTSRKGSRYDDIFSQSHGTVSFPCYYLQVWLTALTIVKSDEHPYPTCTLPTDVFHLPTINTQLPLSFAYCRPLKFSRNTLEASGSTLGLAPSEHLSQTGSTSLLKQLLDTKTIERPIFSLMLFNGHEGVLSVGGTGASAVQLVEQQTRDELDRVGAVERGEISPAPNSNLLTKRAGGAEVAPAPDNRLVKRSGRGPKGVVSRQAEWEEGWTWNKVQGAEGWWQILMQAIWVDGSKVLQNQAVVIDVGSFHLAHLLPMAANMGDRLNIYTDQ